MDKIKRIIKFNARVLQLIILIIFFIYENIFIINSENQTLKIYIIITAVLFLSIFFRVYSDESFKISDIKFLFLIMLFIFMYLRVYIVLFNNLKNFGETTWFYPIIVEKKIQIFTLKCLIFNCFGIILGIESCKIMKFKEKKVDMFKEKFFLKISLILFYLTYPGTILRIIYEYKYFLKVGYAEAMYGGDLGNQIPNIIRICSQLNIRFFIIIMILSDKRKKIIILFLYFLSILLKIPYSGRAAIITTVLAAIWILEKKIQIKLKKKFYVTGFLILFSYSIYTIFKRNLNTNLTEALWIQGETVAQLNYLGKYYLDSLRKYGVLLNFSPIFYIFRGINMNTEISPFYKIYELTSIKEKGAGIGGNYIVDMYIMAKYFGILCFSAINIIFLDFLDKYLEKDRDINLIRIIFMESLVFFTFNMSRQGLFYQFNFFSIIYSTIIYLVFYSLYFILKNYRKNLE